MDNLVKATLPSVKGGVLGEPWFPNIDYHITLRSKETLLHNLKKYRLNENDIFTLAFLASNESLSHEDREKYKLQLIRRSVGDTRN